MVGIRPIYQITCVQKLFPQIKGGAKVADYLLKAIADLAFFQAFSAIGAYKPKTDWNSMASLAIASTRIGLKTTTFKHVKDETSRITGRNLPPA
jgi:hypothetical protein